jgi:hypothetical protein
MRKKFLAALAMLLLPLFVFSGTAQAKEQDSYYWSGWFNCPFTDGHVESVHWMFDNDGVERRVAEFGWSGTLLINTFAIREVRTDTGAQQGGIYHQSGYPGVANYQTGDLGSTLPFIWNTTPARLYITLSKDSGSTTASCYHDI